MNAAKNGIKAAGKMGRLYKIKKPARLAIYYPFPGFVCIRY